MARRLRTASGSFLLRPLNAVFGAPSHVALLRALAQAGRGLTGREVAQAAQVSQGAAAEGLARLEETGVIKRTPAGRAYLYELRREHRLLRTGILPLLDQEAEIRSGVFECLRNRLGSGVLAGWVYGSVARGQEGPASDLDVLVLVQTRAETRRLEERVAAVVDQLRRDFDVRPSVVVMTRVEFLRGYRAKRVFMLNVAREAEVFAGRAPRAVLDE